MVAYSCCCGGSSVTSVGVASVVIESLDALPFSEICSCAIALLLAVGSFLCLERMKNITAAHNTANDCVYMIVMCDRRS
jgi:hypothetical protein